MVIMQPKFLNKNNFIISKSRLEGSVTISSAKNSVLRLLAASLLTQGSICLNNFPRSILDGQIHIGMLHKLGKFCKFNEDALLIEENNALITKLIWKDISIRNTLLILGALLTRFGEGSVPLPGGCNIGERKFDIHEMILKKLGAEVWVEEGNLCAYSKNRLVGSDIYLPLRSTGATENGIICGTLAKGITNIWNPHIRPEIIDLINFLRGMGAKIKVHGQERIEIEGRDKLNGIKYSPIADNMEAITWFIASVITNGDMQIINFPYKHLEIPLIYLRESGAKFYIGENDVIVRGGRPYPIEISTGPYPGINSDMQPLFAVYGMCANGESRIIDLRFPGRYRYTEELAKMGLDFKITGNLLIIKGGSEFHGAKVRAVDLRAGVALVLAGCIADGQTYIEDSYQIERGYDNFINKFKQLNGLIEICE
jgi:UDP-N-acetylglucosamine 1-carboxyvinyltransferase